MGNCLITRRGGVSGGGGGSDYYWRVRFYNSSGTVLQKEEYVLDGQTPTYGSGLDWATQPGQTSGGSTGTITGNTDFYAVEGLKIVQLENPLYSEIYPTGIPNNRTGTYTANISHKVIAINWSINLFDTSGVSTCTITSTGTIEQTITQDNASSARQPKITVAIINVTEGDTITFNTSHVSNCTTTHLVFPYNGSGTIAIEEIVGLADARTPSTYTAQSAFDALVMGLQGVGSQHGADHSFLDCAINFDGIEVTEYKETETYNTNNLTCVAAANVSFEGSDTVSISYGNGTFYVGESYAVIRF